MHRLVTHNDIARAIANTYGLPTGDNPNAPIVRYYRADGTLTVNKGEAQYMSRYNPLTRWLRVMLYPHHETIGLFCLG